MANLFQFGFETHYTKAAVERLFPTNSVDAGVTFPAGRIHGKCIAGSTTQTKLGTPTLAVTGSTAIIGFAINATSPEAGPKLIIYDGATEQIRVEVSNVTGTGYKLSVKRGASVLGTTAVEILNGQWYYIDFKVTLTTGATGTVEIRVNLSAASGFSASSVQTANAGTTAWTRVEFYVEASVAGGAADKLDDAYIFDASGAANNDYAGDVFIEGFTTTADGDSLQWTPLGGGTHFSELDEAGASDDDASYVQTATNNNLDLLKVSALAVATGNIKAVQVNVDARILAAGSRNLQVAHKHTDATLSTSASKAINDTAFKNYFQSYDVNPATGVAFQLADFNTGGTPAQFGVKAVA